MSNKIRDFKCGKCGLVFEKWVSDDTLKVKCSKGAVATRCLSAPKCFQNTTGKSPSAS